MQILFLTFTPPLCFLAELEKKVAEATSAADALKRSLDAEVSERSALEVVVASACEGLGVEAGVSGSSLWGRVGALYSRARERLREALHVGVKKALSMVSSDYVGIDFPTTRWRPRRSCRSLPTRWRLRETPWPVSATPKWSCPPLACRILGSQGSEALVSS